MKIPPQKKYYFWKAYKKQILALGGSMIFTLGLFTLAHFEERLYDKKLKLRIPGNHEYRWHQENKEVEESSSSQILSTTSTQYKKVKKILDNIQISNPNMEIQFEIVILNDSSPNAEALPSGEVIVCTGLIDIANEDQITATICHELSHVFLQHSIYLATVNLISKACITALTYLLFLTTPIIVALPISASLYSLSYHLIALPNSRRDELEADQLGMEMAARSCIDPREFSALWDKYEMLLEKKDHEFWFFSTHPTFMERRSLNEKNLEKLLAIRKEHNCEPLPSKDPREVYKKSTSS